jgi:transcriptional regulator with XRE-family HTH domain
MASETRRKQLGQFLRQCRSRIDPAEYGIRLAGRRRVSGLRREELCSEAGVGLTWYTWLEQGREIHVSHDVLRAISKALRLTSAERRFLFSLVDEAADRPGANDRAVPDVLSRILRQWMPLPAMLTNYRYDILDFNEASHQVFQPIVDWDPPNRNIIRFAFLSPEAPQVIENWEDEVRKILGRFRYEVSSRLDDDPGLKMLISELAAGNPAFTRLWNEAAVRPREHGQRTFRHAREGRLTLEYTPLIVNGQDGLTIVLFSPAPGTDTDEKLRRLASPRKRNSVPRRSAGRRIVEDPTAPEHGSNGTRIR